MEGWCLEPFGHWSDDSLGVRPWLQRESNPQRAGFQPAALPVSYRSLVDEADGIRTRNLPSDSRARWPLRYSFKAMRGSWHGGRMNCPPGSRVISCEQPIHRRPGPLALRSSHASIGCQRAASAQKPNAPPAIGAGGALLLSPRGWTGGLGQRSSPLRLRSELHGASPAFADGGATIEAKARAWIHVPPPRAGRGNARHHRMQPAGQS